MTTMEVDDSSDSKQSFGIVRTNLVKRLEVARSMS